MDAGKASRTAVLVCQGRAAADGRIAPGRFADPVAVELLRDDERRPVQWVRDGQPPRGFAERSGYEMVRASAEVTALRTIAIDDAVHAHPTPQLVIVGAGLDTRAWRLAGLAGVAVFEVDHPATQADKRTRTAGLAPLAASLRFVPVDLSREGLDTALVPAGHRPDEPTTWIWEGVVPYLTRAEVGATVEAIAGLSAPGSQLIVNYQSPSVGAAIGQWVARAMMAVSRQRSLWADEPRRSTWTPEALGRLLSAHGFTVRGHENLLALAGSLQVPVRQRGSLRTGQVTTATR